MKVVVPHPWEVSAEEGKRIQRELRDRLSTTWEPIDVKTVAGVDVGMEGEEARAAVVVLSYPELTPLDQALAQVPVTMPYIPGLLAFREAPAILAACERLKREPDLFIFDGQGLGHPRRLGRSWIDLLSAVPNPASGAATMSPRRREGPSPTFTTARRLSERWCAPGRGCNPSTSPLGIG